MERSCSLGKAVLGNNIFQTGYDVNEYSITNNNNIFQINFDRAYILNTFCTMVMKEYSNIRSKYQKTEHCGNRLRVIRTKHHSKQYNLKSNFLEDTNDKYGDLVLCRFCIF